MTLRGERFQVESFGAAQYVISQNINLSNELELAFELAKK